MNSQNIHAVVAPLYDDEDDPNVVQAITSGLASSNLPNKIMHLASTAPTQENEAIVGVVVIDASSTMYPNREAVVEAMNIFRAQLMKSKERRKMSVMIIFFDSEVRVWKPWLTQGDDTSFMTVVEGDPHCMPEFTSDVYNMDPRYAMTALYDATLEGMASADLMASAIADDEEGQGADVRQICILVGDGFDNSSRRGSLTHCRNLITARALRENAAVIFFGIISDELRGQVATKLGINLSGRSPEEIEEFNDRIFQTIAFGADSEIETAIRAIEGRGELGGMGIPKTMVMTFPSDPEEIQGQLGIKMSSTFIKGTAGQIKATQPLKQQIAGPDDDDVI